jgi:hypothetical protein
MRSTGRPRGPGRSSGEAGGSGVRSADRRRAALPAAERTAAHLLAALGAALDAEQLRQTPRRVAQPYAELLTPRPFNPTTPQRRALRRAGRGPRRSPFSRCARTICSLPRQGAPGRCRPRCRGGKGAVGPPLLAFSTRPRGRSHFTPYCLAGRLCPDRPALAPIAHVPEHPLVPAHARRRSPRPRAR